MSEVLIRELEYYNNIDTNLIGNKARNTLEMYKHGFNIPKSWVIEPRIIIEALEKVNLYHDGIDINDLSRASEYISDYIYESILSKLKEDVNKIIKKSTNKSLVVRSSGFVEDSESHSFAGMFDTVVNVKSSWNIVDSIIEVWKSSFSEEVQETCIINNIKKIHPCAILIQELINSKVGGVAIKDSNKLYINSSFGLAQSIVDGIVDPDEWIVDTINSKFDNIKLGSKIHGIYPVFSKTNYSKGDRVSIQVGDGNYECTVCDNDNDTEMIMKVKLCEKVSSFETIDTNQMLKLINKFESLGECMNFKTYDIEWCINHNDELYFLQIRKITSDINQKSYFNKTSELPLVQGIALGKAIIVENSKDLDIFEEGAILVTKKINGAAIHASSKASGCIVESNSALSHSAIMARELGIPCIGVKSIGIIEQNKFYKINGFTGTVKKIDEKNTKIQEVEIIKHTPPQIFKNKLEKFYNDLIFIPKEW